MYEHSIFYKCLFIKKFTYKNFKKNYIKKYYKKITKILKKILKKSRTFLPAKCHFKTYPDL